MRYVVKVLLFITSIQVLDIASVIGSHVGNSANNQEPLQRSHRIAVLEDPSSLNTRDGLHTTYPAHHLDRVTCPSTCLSSEDEDDEKQVLHEVDCQYEVKFDIYLVPLNVTKLVVHQCAKLENLTSPILSKFTNLRILEITRSNITNITGAFLFGLSNLTKLSLKHNLITALEPGLFKSVPNLCHLDLRGNPVRNLTSLAETVSVLPNAKHLLLDGNQGIKKIRSDDFKSLRNSSIEELSLSNCNIAMIEADALKPLQRLKCLFLSNNIISAKALLNMSRGLSSTDIENLQIRNLNSLFTGGRFVTMELQPLVSTNLSFLDLDYNNISRLYDYDFPKLKNLSKLKMNYCRLEFISQKAFSQLTALKELYLSHNKLGSIEFYVPSLHTLNISSNFHGNSGRENFLLADNMFRNFQKLRKFTLRKAYYRGPITELTFSGFSTLERLEISSTFFRSISQFAFSDLHNLKNLLLNYNHLRDLRSKIFEGLDSLTHLYLSHNLIEYISDSDVFQPLKSLEFLSLRHNLIKELPVHIFMSNVNMKAVVLSGNMISQFDHEIISQSNNSLCELLLDKNDIQVVTPVMLNLFQGLQVVDFADNPLNCNTCDMWHLQSWLHKPGNTTVLRVEYPTSFYMCDDPVFHNFSILDAKIPAELCSYHVNSKGIVLIVSLTILALVLLGLFVSLYKLRWKLRDVIERARNCFSRHREFTAHYQQQENVD